jgi:hypothetical protein
LIIISKELNILVINYTFYQENNSYLIESECYDEQFNYDEIILEPFYYSRECIEELIKNPTSIYFEGYGYGELSKDFKRILNRNKSIFNQMIFEKNNYFATILILIYNEIDDKNIFKDNESIYFCSINKN